ncbi:hypothetical protein K7432_017953, partial [Basidiobolus ranarum]
TYRILVSSKSDEIEGLQKELVENLKKFSHILSFKSSGPYFLGEQYSLVEIALSPFVSRLAVIAKFAKFEIPDVSELKAYLSWAESIQKRPSFIQSSLSPEELYNITEKLATKLRALA